MCNKCARASVASTPPVQTLVSWLMSVGWFQRLDCTERGEGWVLLKIPRGAIDDDDVYERRETRDDDDDVYYYIC